MPPLAILQIHNRYRTRGGEETAVDAYEDLLSSFGHRLLRYEADSASVDAQGPAGRLVTAASMLRSRAAARGLEALLERERVDVAHVHNLYPLLSPSVLEVLARRRVPAVMTLHNYRLLAPCGTLFRGEAVCEECAGGVYLPMVVHRCRGGLAESLAYASVLNLHRALGAVVPRIRRFIAPSRFLLERMAERLIPRDRLAHVPLPMRRPPPLPWPSPGPAHALFVGRLSAEKGLRVLLEAAERAPEVPLVIAGGGPLAEELRRRARERSLARVSFVGHVDAARRTALLAEAAFTVSPSVWYENYPFAVLEALAAGRAVLASRIGGLPELVPDDELLLPAGDAAALAERMRAWWSRPDRCREWGEAATRHVARLTEPAAIERQLVAVYRQAIAEG